MRGYEIEPCPECGGEFRWHLLETIGQRLIRGYVKCDGCGRTFGEGLAADEGGDLRSEIARLANGGGGEGRDGGAPREGAGA